MFHSRISGMGYCLPKKILSNKELEKMVNTSDEWIVARTGIHSRHIATEDEKSSDLGVKASIQALANANLKATDIDLIIVASSYSDHLMPNAACIIQEKLKAFQSVGLDISVACCGFVYAFSIANQYIQTGTYKHILIIGTEVLHHIVDYKDRNTCVLFGDGSGACILSQNTDPKKATVYYHKLKTYGNLKDLIYTSSKRSVTEPPDEKWQNQKGVYICMKGSQVFKVAVQEMSDRYKGALKETGFSLNDLDWVVPHQANQRILKYFCKQNSVPEKKMIFDLKNIGNIAAASIPLSMARAIEQGKIKRGQMILFLVVGAGMNSGAIILRY